MNNHSKWRREHNRKLYGVLPPENCQCEICGKLISGRLIMTDHDHKTNQFRGWLCHYCNTGLGWYEQYSQLMKRYLSK